MATSHDIPLTPGLIAPIVFGVAGLNSLRYSASDASYGLAAIKYTAVAAPIVFALGSVSISGTGTLSAPVAPNLLLLLVFGAITLWSVGVWLWPEKAYASAKLDAPPVGSKS
jgi:hypothetical protein